MAIIISILYKVTLIIFDNILKDSNLGMYNNNKDKTKVLNLKKVQLQMGLYKYQDQHPYFELVIED